MKDVAIVKCETYTPEECEAALSAVLQPLGGLSWVKPGMKIAIKANLVSAMKPEKAATTHPTLLAALTRLLLAHGASSVVIGDSPGGLYNAAFLNRVYAATGMHEAEEAGAVLNRDFSQNNADFPEAHIAKHFTYTACLDDADAIISFCKLKSHGMRISLIKRSTVTIACLTSFLWEKLEKKHWKMWAIYGLIALSVKKAQNKQYLELSFVAAPGFPFCGWSFAHLNLSTLCARP